VDKLVIRGGTPIRGSVRISGSKNAALPILATTLLTASELRFSNVPHLRDISTMLRLLASMGARVEQGADGVVTARSDAVTDFSAPYDLVKTMRASILVLGPLLARFGRAHVSFPGGCAIGTRPVDFLITALESLGARIDIESGYVVASAREGLRGGLIDFPKVTVGGTHTALMGAAMARGLAAWPAAHLAVFQHGLAADHWPEDQALTAEALARTVGL